MLVTPLALLVQLAVNYFSISSISFKLFAPLALLVLLALDYLLC